MITFVSLFLGLVFGTAEVEVAVADSVARVEILLDGASIAQIEEAPWRTRCDFGAELLPHHLEAVAYDSSGAEVGRASQWLNLPQPQAVATLLLLPSEPGEPRVARLSWESSVGAQPTSLEITLDGVQLSPEAHADPGRIVIPAVNERQLHVLSAEMQFENGVSSRVDLTFGGTYADAVDTEITALTLLSTGAARPPSVEDIQGWFRKGNETLQVLALEKERAEIVMVMDRPFPLFLEPGSRKKPPKSLDLNSQVRFRFLFTHPEQSQGVASSFELFPISSPFSSDKGSLYYLLTNLDRPKQDRKPWTASAVAVGGLAAYDSRRSRAVVLVPSSTPPSGDSLTTENVEGYLAALGVPIFVWDPKLHHAPHVAEWDNVRSVDTFEELTDAFDELKEHLRRQWIVWIEGRHLPQQIELSPEVEGFELLGHSGD